MFSQEVVESIAKKRNAKAFENFKNLANAVGNNWADAWAKDSNGANVIAYPLWAIEKGYVETVYNDESTRSGGVKAFRVTEKGHEFASSL